MDTFPQDPGRWTPVRGVRVSPPITRLVAAGLLDAELASLLWLLVEANVPLLVATADPGPAARDVLGSFVDLLPDATTRLELQGDGESFDWLGDAAALGWSGDTADDRAPATGIALPPRRVAPPETSYLVAGEIGSGPPAELWGSRVRTVIRALQRGYGLGAVVRAESLEGVFVELAAPPASLTADELRRIGVVLILRPLDRRPSPSRVAGPGGGERADLARLRVAACHYVRPLERDAAGHVQRRPPAILATWDAERDALEHFAWGVTAELAMRAGHGRDEFEGELAARKRLVAGLVQSGRTSHEALHAVLAHRSRPRGGGPA